MTERLRGFHTFNTPEEIKQHFDQLSEDQKAAAEKAWDEYFGLREKVEKVSIEADKHFWEVMNPYLAFQTFAFINFFKGNVWLGVAAHGIGDVLVVKAAYDRFRQTNLLLLEALQKGKEAFRESGIEVSGLRDFTRLFQLYQGFSQRK